ncbi:MAG: SurA N-terminal domain-containing protein [Desulfovibrio sp.]|nr:SurA N-terminal domain-containing protein [Desulfovibrio sp.]
MKKLLVFVPAILLCAVIAAHAAQINKVAAVVNGQVITMMDLQKIAVPDIARARLDPNKPSDAKAIDQVLRKTLDMMIMDILIVQDAKRLKVSIAPSDVDKQIERMMHAHNMTKAQFEEQLAKDKMPLAELRKSIEKNLLRQKIMGLEVSRRVIVTQEEIKAYYESHKDSLFNRDNLHMALLVYPPKANASDLAAQIKNGSLSFEETARKYSIAPNKDKGGDMGPVEWDKLNPEWEGRLTKMKPGDVTEIFVLNNFKAQVRLFRPGGGVEKPLTLEEATPQIDAILRQPKAVERFEEYSAQLRNKAIIDIRL